MHTAGAPPEGDYHLPSKKIQLLSNLFREGNPSNSHCVRKLIASFCSSSHTTSTFSSLFIFFPLLKFVKYKHLKQIFYSHATLFCGILEFIGYRFRYITANKCFSFFPLIRHKSPGGHAFVHLSREASSRPLTSTKTMSSVCLPVLRKWRDPPRPPSVRGWSGRR